MHLQGPRNAREMDREAASWSFLQQRKKQKKKRIVFPPSWPLTARHKFCVRLSRNLTLGLRSREENSRLFLQMQTRPRLKSLAARTTVLTFTWAVAGCQAHPGGRREPAGVARKPGTQLFSVRQLHSILPQPRCRSSLRLPTRPCQPLLSFP